MAGETGEMVYLAGPEELEIREYEVPEPGPDEVLTEIERANVCGSELHIWRGNHPEVKEGVLGHEAVCRIAELGENVETDFAGEPVEEGDLISPAYFLTCRKCPACQRGQFHLCENAYEYWSKSPDEYPHFHGTFATHYVVHADQYFYKIPEGLDAGIAAGANCALSQVMFGLDKVELSADETVVVQGAGGLGLNATALANERGAESIVIEGAPRRIERAREFGADHVIDMREYDSVEQRAERVRELTGGEGADVGVEVAGIPDAFSEGIHLVRTGGRYLEMGNVSPGEFTDFDPGLLTRRSITVETAVRYNPWYLRRALSFLNEHQETYPYDSLIDAEFELRDVREALAKSDSREITRGTLLPSH